MHEISKTIDAVKRIMSAGKRGVLVTVISTRGSTYRRAGARVVIAEDGQGFGLISGGCVERDLAARIESWLQAGRPELFTYDTTNTSDILFGMGLGCRGVMEMLVEPFDADRPPQLVERFRWNDRDEILFTTYYEGRDLLVEIVRPQRAIVIFGGGVDVLPVATLAEAVGWSVTVLNPRDLQPEEIRDAADSGRFDAAVIMTHNFLQDLMLLEALLPSPIPYVGLLGPRTRGKELLEQLGETGRRWGSRLRNPIGLDLGGETPEEIALTIVAEVQSVLNARGGEPLQGREAPLHQRIEPSWV